MPKRTSSRRPKAAPKRKASTNARRVTSKSKKNRLWLPYPLLGFMLLLVGVLLVGATFKSHALSGDYQVRAKVPAPLPTTPAVITSPTNGQHFKLKPVTVSGTCPTDNYPGNYVSVYRNNIFSGSTICQADNTFQMQTDVFEGTNELKAQIFNSTDDAGPASAPVTITFDSTLPNIPGSADSTSIPPMVLKTDFKYRGFFVGRDVTWELEIDGGVAPYAVNVDWGDGTNSLISRRATGKFTVEHTYSKPGSADNTFSIRVHATDNQQRPAFMQFFVRINPFNSPTGAGNVDKLPPASSSPISPDFLKIAWPAYLIVALMTLSFWFGEQEEFFALRRKNAIKKRFT